MSKDTPIEINYINVERLIEVHDRAIDKSGGLTGIKDRGLLESTLYHIQNDMYYPEFLDKLTHLIFSIIKNHCFNDGNKRSAIGASLVLIEHNKSHVSQDFVMNEYVTALENIVVFIAENTLSKDDLHIILSFLTSAPPKEVHAFGFLAYKLGDPDNIESGQDPSKIIKIHLLTMVLDEKYRARFLKIINRAK